MDNIREILGNATMAYTNMNANIDGKKVAQNIFELLDENKESIEKANKIDVKNNNGFKINFDMFQKLNNEINAIEDVYRKVISMNQNKNNYLEGKQTDNLGTICLVYDGNTYCLLELVLKAILTHNSIIITSESDYMKATNELIVILIQRILEAYNIDKNLVQILYTSRIEELLSNSTSINKVFAIGNKSFQDRIRKVSKVEIVCKGYNYFDLYIEDLTNLSFIKKIVKEEENIDIYVKSGLKVPFDDYIEVEDIDEAIAQINFNTSGYSSSIFTDDNQNASVFLREVKADNVSVNSSPLIENIVDVDINLLLARKNMFYPNPLAEGTGKNKFEFPTAKAILEKNKNREEQAMIEEMQKENSKLKASREQLQKQAKMQLGQKEMEVNDLKRQLSESQSLANKYMNIFRKSFFSRLFSGLRKEDIENDTKLLS
ncbi:gamma-glutamyl phosphate reductase [Clostridium sp. CAG:571]|nr:gamma-glutamyl phosphate reductase [Clostridium sp. CAG:571]